MYYILPMMASLVCSNEYVATAEASNLPWLAHQWFVRMKATAASLLPEAIPCRNQECNSVVHCPNVVRKGISSSFGQLPS